MTSNATTCTIPGADFVEAFEAPGFETTETIEWMHGSTPRFGNSNDLMFLLEGSPEEQREYTVGLVASSIAMSCYFLIWFVVLLVFRYLGPERAGFWAGRPRPLPPRPESNSPEFRSWEQQRRQTQRWIQCLRILVCFSGFFVILTAMLMATKGVSSLTKSLDSGRDSISIAQDLANQALTLIDSATEQSLTTSETLNGLLRDFNDICPTLRPEGICTDLDDLSTCDFGGILDADVIQSTFEGFTEAQDSINVGELTQARTDLERFLQMTADMEDNAQSFNWALYMAMIGSLLVAALCSLILVGLVFRNSSVLTCLQHWIVIPGFAFLVACSFGFSILFVIGSQASADLCIDSPDERVLVLMNRFREQLTDIAVDFASFYINECPPDAFPQELSTQRGRVLDAIPALADFSTTITDSSSALQVICGVPDPAQLATLAETTNTQLCQIVDVLNSIELFFQCKNWFPLYESAIYETICYNGTDGFGWVASTQFVIVFFSFVILSFRAAFHNVEEGDADKGYGTDDESVSPRNRPPRITSNGNAFELAYTPKSSRDLQ